MVMAAMVTMAMAVVAMVPVMCQYLSDMGKADQV